MHFGDPSGKSKESDQSCWESNLRSGGVPITCLPGYYQTRDGIEWMIKAVQVMLDNERIRIHQRCSYLWECIEHWRRDVPSGMEIDWVSRAYIQPRKDVYSHGANALMYLVAGANLAMQTTQDVSRDMHLETGPSHSISNALAIQ